MLSSISIKNFAVIKEVNIDLQNGLNIFTGETGSGKSVIIEAISMALGSRADTSYVRKGADKAEVSLVFDLDNSSLKEYFEENGLDYDSQIVIKREINSQSKSICRINGSIVSLSVLNGLCKRIVDIHGQYDQQVLLDEDNHLDILDQFGGSDLLNQKAIVSNKYSLYISKVNELSKLKKLNADSEDKIDFLKYQISEIRNADIKENEDDDLQEQIRIMENSEHLFNSLSIAHNNIFSSDNSADSLLGKALSSLEEIQGISSEIDELISRISNAYYELTDLNSELRNLKDSFVFSQVDLDNAIERQELLNKLKRKYGGSISSILDYVNKAENSLNNIENNDDNINILENEIKELKESFLEESNILSDLRIKTAKILEEKIDKELSQLNFNNAHFKVVIDKTDITKDGIDKITFNISTNTGDAPKALAKIASGGELSRIMLALKTIISDIDSIPTMIFDEIDTGISGATAALVGEKLSAISVNHQVICITHLPQIGCLGQSHFKIGKEVLDGNTQSYVSSLDMNERVEEIARLLSGTEITSAARKQAKEYLGVLDE